LADEYEKQKKSSLPGYIQANSPTKAPIRQIIRIGVPNELILRVIEEENADFSMFLGCIWKGSVSSDANFIALNYTYKKWLT